MARPKTCPSCGACSRLLDGEVVLHGNGVRWRPVVLPGGDRGRVALMGVRRFECKACSAGCSVAPIQVAARHLYSLAAVVHAWMLAAARPLGSGMDDAAVYARQGVDRRPRHDRHPRRWRSLERWSRSTAIWWPTGVAHGSTWRRRTESLVVGFMAGGAGARGVIERALLSHQFSSHGASPGHGGGDGAIRRALYAHVAGGTAM